MQKLTGHERISRFLKRQPHDHIGAYESFWSETHTKWTEEGHTFLHENLDDHFNLDLSQIWCFNNTVDLDFIEELVEEDETTRLTKNGNGAILRWYKDKSGPPENVDYTIKGREQWNEIREKLLGVDTRRINYEQYRAVKNDAKAKDRFFCWSGVNVFELMHPVCGHEYMLMGMALDPDWIRDMVQVFTDMIINLMDDLFAKEGQPDGIYFYEDMGFKERPFMSPAMYRELIFPAHKRTVDYAHARNMPVIMHSCGFVEPLLSDIVKSGIDCLQAIEVKAGMDPLRIQKNYGDVLSLMGGLDVRVMNANDKTAIDRELEAKIPALMKNNGFCLHSDHSIPPEVEYETYKYFREKGRELGTYK